MLVGPARAILLFCLSASGIVPYTDAAIAQPASSPAQNQSRDLALGLEALHWGMSSEMVYAALSGLKLRTGGFQPIKGYDYGGCLFDLDLSVDHDVLDTVSLTASAPSAACREKIVQELRTSFPAPEFTATDGTISQRRTNQRTSVSVYDGRTRLTAEFSAKCQSIRAVVESGVAQAAETGPNIVPDADLGCDEYPLISVRLQESGSVGLSVHVLKDGSVSDAIISAADKSMRLNEAALRIALMRLRFTPATVNGEAVDADVSVKMDFAVIHPIHGNM